MCLRCLSDVCEMCLTKMHTTGTHKKDVLISKRTCPANVGLEASDRHAHDGHHHEVICVCIGTHLASARRFLTEIHLHGHHFEVISDCKGTFPTSVRRLLTRTYMTQQSKSGELCLPRHPPYDCCPGAREARGIHEDDFSH